MSESISITTEYRKGRRLFAKGDVVAYAANKADGSGARGLLWVENPAWDSPRIGEGSTFRDLFSPSERRAVRS